MVLANIGGKALTDASFAGIWKEIDRRALRCSCTRARRREAASSACSEFQLTAPIGFTFDTSLAVGALHLDGFLDRFPKLKLIAAHGGGALPYLVGRLDICWRNIPAASAKTKQPPSEYMRRIYVDSVVFQQSVLNLALEVCGDDHVLLRLRLSAHHRRHAGASRASTPCPARPGTRCAAATRSASFGL